VAGVNPLAPTFDTVGIFAQSADVLAKVARVLLARGSAPATKPGTIHLIREAFALADVDVQQALLEPVRRLRDFFSERAHDSSLGDLVADEPAHDFTTWSDIYCVIQWAEIKSCLGAWIADAKPQFAPNVAASFELTNQLDRRRVAPAFERRGQYFRRLNDFLGPEDLLCIPTTPALAPRKGAAPRRSSGGSGYYPRTLGLTSLSGIAQLPQVSMPVANVETVPVGLSLLARHGQDALLLETAKSLAAEQRKPNSRSITQSDGD
jgi:amidase